MPAIESITIQITGTIRLPGRVLKTLRNSMPHATDEEIARRLACDVAEYFARRNRLELPSRPEITVQTAMGRFVCAVPVNGGLRYVEIETAEWPWKTRLL